MTNRWKILAGLTGAGSGWLASGAGYQWHFIIAGALGVLMLLLVWNFLRRHPQLNGGRRVATSGERGQPT